MYEPCAPSLLLRFVLRGDSENDPLLLCCNASPQPAAVCSKRKPWQHGYGQCPVLQGSCCEGTSSEVPVAHGMQRFLKGSRQRRAINNHFNGFQGLWPPPVQGEVEVEGAAALKAVAVEGGSGSGSSGGRGGVFLYTVDGHSEKYGKTWMLTVARRRCMISAFFVYDML